MDPDGGGQAEIELVDAPRPRRRRFGLLAANLSVIAAALVGIYVLARDDEPDAQPPDTTVPPSSTVEPTIEELLTIMPASPIDGKQSQKLPVAVRPRVDLADGQVVTVLAKGFLPGERVGVVMCVAEAALEGVDACDLGPNGTFDHVAYTDASPEGFVQLDVAVRRAIVTPFGGPVDCASGPERCVVAVGAVGDYDRSGGAPVGFAGQPPFPEPTLTVAVPGPYASDQVVDVAAAGLLWPREAQIQLCRAEQCIALFRGRVALDGTLASPVPLPWSFVLADGTVVTCDAGCELRVGYLALPDSTQAPTAAALLVEFTAVDPAAPPVPATVPPTTVPVTAVATSPATLPPIATTIAG